MDQENGARIFLGIHDGGTMRLEEDEATHCVKVLRHREGDEINVIDGEGSLYHCRILSASPKSVEAGILDSVPDFGAHPYHLTMAVCPTKNLDRYEWFAEKATEIGVDVIVPVIGDRSERRVLKRERLERIVVSAAKQSLKGAVPQVRDSVSVKDFILGSADNKGIKLICYCIDKEERRQSICDALDSCPDNKNVTVLIGPEGDFSTEEVDMALEHGWLPVSLGDSRLRTETAAVVAATAVYLR